MVQDTGGRARIAIQVTSERPCETLAVGLKFRIGGPALHQHAVGATAEMGLEIGAAMLHGAHRIGIGDETTFAHEPGFAIGPDRVVDGAKVCARVLCAHGAAQGAIDRSLCAVPIDGRDGAVTAQ